MDGESSHTATTHRGGSGPWTDVREWVSVHGRSLLFVDDSGLLLELVADAFEKAGSHCRTASTHDEAVQLLGEDTTLRVAVLDFEMPDGDVAGLIRRMRFLRPDVRLVGSSGADRRRQFAERGVDRFVAKPWRLADLIEASGL